MLVIALIIGYVIYEIIGLLGSLRDSVDFVFRWKPHTDIVLLICILIYLAANLLVVNLIDYKTEMVDTLRVISFESTQVKNSSSSFFDIFHVKREEIKYRVVAEKDGQVVEYLLKPEEVQLQKIEDKQSKLEIYTAKCTNPILQIFFFLPEKTKYKLFL